MTLPEQIVSRDTHVVVLRREQRPYTLTRERTLLYRSESQSSKELLLRNATEEICGAGTPDQQTRP